MISRIPLSLVYICMYPVSYRNVWILLLLRTGEWEGIIGNTLIGDRQVCTYTCVFYTEYHVFYWKKDICDLYRILRDVLESYKLYTEHHVFDSYKIYRISRVWMVQNIQNITCLIVTQYTEYHVLDSYKIYRISRVWFKQNIQNITFSIFIK